MAVRDCIQNASRPVGFFLHRGRLHVFLGQIEMRDRDAYQQKSIRTVISVANAFEPVAPACTAQDMAQSGNQSLPLRDNNASPAR